MFKRKLVVVSFTFMLMGMMTMASVSAHEPGPSQPDHSKMEKTDWKSLIEQGYTKEEIFHAKGIAMFASEKLDIAVILKQYKQSGSWEKTAEHFKVDYEKVKAKHEEMKAKHEEMKKFYKENEEAIFQFLAEYTNTPIAELQYLKTSTEKFCIHKFMKAAVIAKLSNRPVVELWNEHQAGTSLKEIAKKHNLDKDVIRQEMKNMKQELKSTVRS